MIKISNQTIKVLTTTRMEKKIKMIKEIIKCKIIIKIVKDIKQK